MRIPAWTANMNQNEGNLSDLHPGRWTWNLQITHLERKMIFQTSMILFKPLIFRGVFTQIGIIWDVLVSNLRTPKSQLRFKLRQPVDLSESPEWIGPIINHILQVDIYAKHKGDHFFVSKHAWCLFSQCLERWRFFWNPFTCNMLVARKQKISVSQCFGSMT